MYTLLGLVRTYGPGPVDAACATALEFDVIAVPKIASMLEQATENTTRTCPWPPGRNRLALPATPPNTQPTEHS
ncbi:hypothetical protein [Gordonia ajococcus]|uniref:hypothetical protein n=1 Tax=Gordonia ajococcus TaxID=1292359 RepID=UPI00177C5EE0|nr:hypothetical protein [Gordonia ajococcus]